MNPTPSKAYYKQKTERLNFRALTVDDIATWASFFDNNPTERFMGGPLLGKNRIEKSKTWIMKQIERQKEGTYGQLAIIEKATGSFIGVGGIIERDLDGNVEFEVTYSLLPTSWGKGYATELAKHFKKYIFNKIEAPSAISMIHMENEASMNVAKKNGMRIEGETEFLDMPIYIFRVGR